MTQTYTIRHEVYIRVEANSRAEAGLIAAKHASRLRENVPTNVTLSTSRVIQR